LFIIQVCVVAAVIITAYLRLRRERRET
jgi:hypothetical protein